jgi:hypothetical protein
MDQPEGCCAVLNCTPSQRRWRCEMQLMMLNHEARQGVQMISGG